MEGLVKTEDVDVIILCKVSDVCGNGLCLQMGMFRGNRVHMSHLNDCKQVAVKEKSPSFASTSHDLKHILVVFSERML